MTYSLDAACRVAFAGLVHDLGKFAQRGDLTVPQTAKELHQQLYCPQKSVGTTTYWTHQHAAFTALFFDVLEKAAPDLVKGSAYPFASRSCGEDITDSIVNAASAHHKPSTFLQWIIATADRVASGFERDEYADQTKQTGRRQYVTTRLRSLFEEISISNQAKALHGDLRTGLPLKALTPEALFPQSLTRIETNDVDAAAAEYRNLWTEFELTMTATGPGGIPSAFRKNWPLWLDVFDTAWLAYTSSIPSATAFNVRPDVSLYDHCKTTAALATALWGWHEENGKTGSDAIEPMKSRSDWNEKKFLLVQGDFFGIQNFIFAEGSQTNKKSAKILRGRSFYVSLLTELAALKVMQALHLPSTSQIINAAGKFLIVAPNTSEVKRALQSVRQELDAWFVRNTFAVSGLGLVTMEASCNDFLSGQYEELNKRLFEAMDVAKCRRFDLAARKNPVMEADYGNGVCSWQSHLPADGKPDSSGNPSCALSRDQIGVGEALVKYQRVLILEGDADIRNSPSVKVLELPVFGYKVAFVQDAETSGNFGRLAETGKLLRCWDFSLPERKDQVLWQGCARRNINGYVPRYKEADFQYGGVEYEEGKDVGLIKLFSDVASVDSHDGRGVEALMTVKGDVDNLGMIFQSGLSSGGRRMTFAKTAALSREMNAFFSVWLPLVCREKYPDVYTIFAGGDDFFMIGPWKETQGLVRTLAEDFKRYVADNPEVHFSVGTQVTKASVPVRVLAEVAEEALSEAKSFEEKNRVVFYGEVVRWDELEDLKAVEAFLEGAAADYGVSSGYLYQLFEILTMAGEETSRPEAALWRSRLYYRTARLFERQRQAGSRNVEKDRNDFMSALIGYLEKEKSKFRIPLTNVFYSIREVKGK